MSCFPELLETGKEAGGWGEGRGSTEATALLTDGAPKANGEAAPSRDLAQHATLMCDLARLLHLSVLLSHHVPPSVYSMNAQGLTVCAGGEGPFPSHLPMDHMQNRSTK